MVVARERTAAVPARDAYDSPWKEYLDNYLEPSLAFVFPRIHAEIDWAAGIEHLDNELRQIGRDAALSEARADKLVKVRRFDGTDQYLILHVEVQTSYDADLARRVFVYNYRTFDQHGMPVVSLVLLGDTSKEWSPTKYGWDIGGCKMGIEFPVVKLIDYNERWSELEAETNPVALVVMAHLKTKETRGDTSSRLTWKKSLVRLLYERGYERRDVLELYRILDWMLKLPQDEEALFQEELRRIEEELAMPYVTAIERMGEERGIQLGEVKILKRQMSRQYGPLPGWVEERLAKASLDDLERWADRVLDAASIEEVFGSNGA